MNPLQRIRRRLEAHPVHSVDPRTGYDLWAAEYDREDNPLRHLERQSLQRLLPNVSDKRVLDLGCGTGTKTEWFAERDVSSVVGVDLSWNMLREARNQLRGIKLAKLSCATALALPFQTSSFDVAIASLVLGYVEDLGNAARELARVSRVGGTILISDFHPCGRMLGWNRSYLHRRNGRIEEFCLRNHLHLHEDYFRAFQRANLKVVDLCEPLIDESIKHFFDRSRRGRKTYEQFVGSPLVLIFHVTRK